MKPLPLDSVRMIKGIGNMKDNLKFTIGGA